MSPIRRQPETREPAKPADADSARDLKLLRRIAKTDLAALGTLAGLYEPSLLGLARALLTGRDDLARDAVQDTWERVIRGARSFAERSTVRTWLYRILVNRCHDLRAKAARERSPVLARLPRAEAAEPAERMELSTRVRAAAAELPDGQRLVLLLCYHRSLSHTQAAEVLDIPVGTLKSRLAKALASLRDSLDSESMRHNAGSVGA